MRCQSQEESVLAAHWLALRAVDDHRRDALDRETCELGSDREPGTTTAPKSHCRRQLGIRVFGQLRELPVRPEVALYVCPTFLEAGQ
jgi:hypothetical protein